MMNKYFLLLLVVLPTLILLVLVVWLWSDNKKQIQEIKSAAASRQSNNFPPTDYWSARKGTKGKLDFPKTGTFNGMDIDKLTCKMEDARPVGIFEGRE